MADMKIPILDLRPEIAGLWEELTDAFHRVLKSTQFIGGPEVEAFEKEVASYLGSRHAVGMNSGTDALYIGLKALGIGAGDEVVTTGFTFFASAEAISHVGATPVLVDIDPKTFNIDMKLLARAITPKTKAVIPVHLYGQGADMNALMDLAHRHKIAVLEDVAQAFGGAYGGKKLGTIGTAGAFSFFPSKNLGAYGDGGLLATNDQKVADLARALRAHGGRKKYYNEMIGYNSRLDSLQAAILRTKLPHLDAWNEGRKAAARRYDALLRGLSGVEMSAPDPKADHVYHQYTIRIKGGRRDAVHDALAAKGIQTMVYYPLPVHHLPVYKETLGRQFRLPVSETAAGEVLSLPIWPQITVDVQKGVVDALKHCLS